LRWRIEEWVEEGVWMEEWMRSDIVKGRDLILCGSVVVVALGGK
jgi:hypothetical protein